MSGLRSDRDTSASHNGRELADDLLGEVRLVDPSTPLTKDHHNSGSRR
jgi:hypothetical protein